MRNLIYFIISLIFVGCNTIVGGYGKFSFPDEMAGINSSILYLKKGKTFLFVNSTDSIAYYTHGSYKKKRDSLYFKSDSLDYPFIQCGYRKGNDTTIKFLDCGEVVLGFTLYKDSKYIDQMEDNGEIHLKNINGAMNYTYCLMGSEHHYSLNIPQHKEKYNYFIVNHVSDYCHYYNGGSFTFKMIKDSIYSNYNILDIRYNIKLKLVKGCYLSQ